jgi:hypothetical protein
MKPMENNTNNISSGNKYQWQDDWDMDEQGFLNEEVIPSTNNTLPVEVQESIKGDAAKYTNKRDESLRSRSKDYGRRMAMLDGLEEGYIAGATEYAQWKVKYDELIKEVEQLRQWKNEAIAILNPIWDYADNEMNIPLGKSKTDAVLERAKKLEQAKKLLEKVISEDELDFFGVSTELYNDIKSFLNGSE